MTAATVALGRTAYRLRIARAGTLEALAIVGLYLGEALSRGLAAGGPAAAARHAADIVHAERAVHLFGEPAIQRAAHAVYGLPMLLGYAYLTLHLAVAAAALVWVYRRRRLAYRRLLGTLVLANALAVVGYALFPTAPPRLAGVGVADTVSHATSINLSSSLVSSFYNPYAAVPSMHIGYSVIVAAAVWRLTSRRRWRLAAVAYPLFVLFVIVATGNHFFLDAAAGALVAAVSIATVEGAAPRVARWRRHVEVRLAEPSNA
jgi:hypothetical protein